MSAPIIVWLHGVNGLQFGLGWTELVEDLASVGIELHYEASCSTALEFIRREPRVRAIVQNMRRETETSGVLFIDKVHKLCTEVLHRHIPIATLAESLVREPARLVNELASRLETDLRSDPRTPHVAGSSSTHGSPKTAWPSCAPLYSCATARPNITRGETGRSRIQPSPPKARAKPHGSKHGRCCESSRRRARRSSCRRRSSGQSRRPCTQCQVCAA